MLLSLQRFRQPPCCLIIRAAMPLDAAAAAADAAVVIADTARHDAARHAMLPQETPT